MPWRWLHALAMLEYPSTPAATAADATGTSNNSTHQNACQATDLPLAVVHTIASWVGNPTDLRSLFRCNRCAYSLHSSVHLQADWLLRWRPAGYYPEAQRLQLLRSEAAPPPLGYQVLYCVFMNVHARTVQQRLQLLEQVLMLLHATAAPTLLTSPASLKMVNDCIGIACLKGYHVLLRRLLRIPGAAPNQGCSAWLLALADSDSPITPFRWQPAVEVSTGETPLMVACKAGQLTCVVALLEQPGIDFQAADNMGETALLKACYAGHLAVVNTLLFHPTTANVIDVTVIDTSGVTPLRAARAAGHTEIVELMCQIQCIGLF